MAVGSSGDRLRQTRLIPRSPDGDNKLYLEGPVIRQSFFERKTNSMDGHITSKGKAFCTFAPLRT